MRVKERSQAVKVVCEEALTLLFCLIGFFIGTRMIIEDHAAGWFCTIVFGFGGVFWGHHVTLTVIRMRSKRRWRAQKQQNIEAKLATVAKFEYENAVSFWEGVLKGAAGAWVVFKNGTVVLCDGDKDTAGEYANAAKECLARIAGSYPGDFSVELLPHAGVWLVSYPGGKVFNYLETDTCPSDTAAGLIARTIRDDDAEQLEIIHIGVKKGVQPRN